MLKNIFLKSVIWHQIIKNQNACYVIINTKRDSAFINIKKIKNHINTKNAKISMFYKMNKKVLIINCKTNNDFSTKQKLITSKKNVDLLTYQCQTTHLNPF